MRPAPMVPLAPLLAALALSCGHPARGTLALTTGGEADAWSRAPAAARVLVTLLAPPAPPAIVAQGPATAALELPDLSTGLMAAFRVEALDASGATRLRGATPFLSLGDVAGQTLAVFVQRTGEFARWPAALPSAPTAPSLAWLLERYVVVGSGAGQPPVVYLCDTASYRASTLPLPRPPSSLVADGPRLLVVDDQGATWFDVATGASVDVPAPEGGTFADVAGGAVIEGDGGEQLVVGATRRGLVTDRVLRVGLDGSLSFATLAHARAQAAATWAPGQGLFVVGGSATAPAVELLPRGASTATPLPYAPREALGSAAILDAGSLLVLGGASSGVPAAPERFDPQCTRACVATSAGPPLPLALMDAQAFSLEASTIVVTGVSAEGSAAAFRVDHTGTTAPTAITLRTPRKDSRTLRLPWGAVVEAGGDGSLESYVP